jgi:hypothetical protein
MRKNENTKLGISPPRSRDILVCALCILGAGFFQYLFWTDFYRTLTRLSAAPVGIISFKYNAAQRRFVDRVLWDRLRRESPVYNGDFIRTAEISEATIRFSGGALIDLEENSLIQVRRENDRSLIDVSEGGLSVQAREDGFPLELSLGGGRLELAPGGVVSVQASPGGIFRAQVVEGSASLISAGETRSLDAGTGFSLSEDGRPLELPQVIMLSPRPVLRALSPGDALEVPFSWNTVNFTGEEGVRLEIASDRGFTRPVFTHEAAGAGTARARLAAGTWFWRACPGNTRESASSSSGKLVIIHAPPPALISPAEASICRYRLKPPEILFQWTPSENAEAFILEAADNPAMRNPRLQTRVKGASMLYSGLEEGLWYWRALPVFAEDYEGTPGPSATASFRIERSDALPRPVLQVPPAGGFVPIAPDREDVYFSWKNEPEAASYTLLISASPDLGTPVITRTAAENYCVYGRRETILEEGQYYWGVCQTDAEGNDSPLSPARNFFTAAEEPVSRPPVPPDDYTGAGGFFPDSPEKPAPVSLDYPPTGTVIEGFTAYRRPGVVRWSSPETPGASLFILSQDSDPPGERPLMELRSPGKTLRLPPLTQGTYYWTIRAAAAGGQDISAERPSSFRVLPPPLLPEAPERLPPDNYTVGPAQLREKRSLDFRWNPVQGASAYIFSLLQGGKELIRVGPGAKTFYVLEDLSLLAPGDFIWRVEAIYTEGKLVQRGRIGENRFTVDILLPRALPDHPGTLYGRQEES